MCKVTNQGSQQSEVITRHLHEFMVLDDPCDKSGSLNIPPLFFALIRQAKEGAEGTAE